MMPRRRHVVEGSNKPTLLDFADAALDAKRRRPKDFARAMRMLRLLLSLGHPVNGDLPS